MRGLTARLLIFNLLLAVFPVGATLFLGTYEEQLLESQERAMVQQGRILASALEGTNLAEEAAAVLGRLGARNDSRLRVVDEEGRLLADSATPVPRDLEAGDDESGGERSTVVGSGSRNAEAAPAGGGETPSYPEESVIYQIGALPARTIRRVTGFIQPPEAPKGEAEYYIGREILDGPEIKAALIGRYGAATRISQGQKSVTLYSAIPIVRHEEVIGAVLVSRSTFAILNDLYQLRLDTTIIFLFGIGGAIILSVLLARTVTVPVGRLRDQAESLLDERGKLKASFNPQSGRDEVADLSRALHRLSARLQERTDHLEDFMADLVHEMKNPVAGILSAAELADRSVDAEAKRFLDVIDREGRRIERLLDDLRELISVDVRLDRGDVGPVNLDGFVRTLVDSYPQHRRIEVSVDYVDPIEEAVHVNADPDRLAQAVLNLVDNAVSFSPAGGRVELRVKFDEQRAAVSVSDEGPGIPEDDVEKIFERWYTDRPANEASDHTGLGLAIVRGIALGYDGTVSVHNKDRGGAEFVIEFPRSPS